MRSIPFQIPAGLPAPIRAMAAALAILAAPAFVRSQPALEPGQAPPSSARDAWQAGAVSTDYSSNILIIHDAQEQTLEQARQMLESREDLPNRAALDAAMKNMDRSKVLLAQAQHDPGKLAAALAAQQAAYQDLLKLVPREFRVGRSRNGGQGSNAGQPAPRELDQLEMTGEENRYETERQAAATPDARQHARVLTADRLKQLAQRQQDLNDRLRELQTALQEARTDQERETARRELQRLQEQERRMLSDLDELRQQLASSPDPSASAQTREQLDQTRSQMERASEEMGRDAASQALAAGSRAQDSMQQLRESLRRSTASQFSEQMRQMRSQVRQLASNENDLARQLESAEHPEHASLDDSAQRGELARRLAAQQNALTNLLSGMRAVSEQSETVEPLLSRQLYDTLRRAEQAGADRQLDAASQLAQRGFIPQAAEAEQPARQNIDHLRQDIERAAESVLGNEAESLRYARDELQNLSRQVEREIGSARTNSGPMAGSSAGTNSAPDQSAGSAARAESGRPAPSTSGAAPGSDAADRDRLRQIAEQLGHANPNAGDGNGPITGGGYADWSERMRDVEQVLDSPELRNRLASVRERVGAFRGYYRREGRIPESEAVRQQVLTPMTQIRAWLQDELARQQDAHSLVPLDQDPVPGHYSELVRRYYEKLGNAQ